MRFFALCVTVGCCLFTLHGGASVRSCRDVTPLSLTDDTRMFQDSQGRERFFHGVNVVYKSAPYLPLTRHFDPQLSLSDHDLRLLDEWGVNAIRLGVMWPGAEPHRGAFNQSYAKHAQEIVNAAAAYGMYSIIDAHQDVMSEKFCGEGVPSFAALIKDKSSFPRPLQFEAYHVNNEGIPSYEDCQRYPWQAYYATFTVAAAFQSWYDNINGIAEAFADYWMYMADVFADNDAVLGFELLNEPFAGDIFKHPELLSPRIANYRNLQPFYERIAAAIRKRDKSRLILFEPVTWSNSVGYAFDGTGFTQAPGGPQKSNSSILACHYYDPPNFGNRKKYLNRVTHDAARLNVGVMVTEFNLSSTMAHTADDLDKMRLSWTAWEYKKYAGSLPHGTCTGCDVGPLNVDGSINLKTATALSRPYAQAVAGKTLKNEFDSNTRSFTLQFRVDTFIRAPTVVYVSPLQYVNNEFNVKIEPDTAATWSKSSCNGPHRYIVTLNSTVAYESLITVTLTAKQSVVATQ